MGGAKHLGVLRSLVNTAGKGRGQASKGFVHMTSEPALAAAHCVLVFQTDPRENSWPDLRSVLLQREVRKERPGERDGEGRSGVWGGAIEVFLFTRQKF